MRGCFLVCGQNRNSLVGSERGKKRYIKAYLKFIADLFVEYIWRELDTSDHRKLDNAGKQVGLGSLIHEIDKIYEARIICVFSNWMKVIVVRQQS